MSAAQEEQEAPELLIQMMRKRFEAEGFVPFEAGASTDAAPSAHAAEDPARPPSKAQVQASAYLQKHRIPEILDALLAQAAMDRPQDLRAYLVQTLTAMRAGSAQSMGPFTDEDISTMFDMWDELGQGVIPATRVVQQLKALQVPADRAETVVVQALKTPELAEIEVDKSVFATIVKAELLAMFSVKPAGAA
eukprot:TRINITY_DN55837_c0_g1_i1.p1 TRINITY_DN55837_c0_g1~~TRINITY_DN55837_c0_g1_i1.p1  ORF type:complete len:192 (+),score=54.69 TRINITY_DN55837_c0_g1_i1:143-718(+)